VPGCESASCGTFGGVRGNESSSYPLQEL